VILPEDLEWRIGDDFGDILHGGWLEGDIVQLVFGGGEFPHADEELPELVLLLL